MTNVYIGVVVFVLVIGASLGILSRTENSALETVKSELEDTVEAVSTLATTSPSSLTADIIFALDVPKKENVPQDALSTPPRSISADTVPVPADFTFKPEWRDTVVNLICANNYGESMTSGSGVMVDPRGVILTNAHVATSFLFGDWPSPSLFNCSVRVGSPAYPAYRAVLLYIPDEYVRDTVAQLYKPDDSAYIYGENDYALLLISGRTNPSASLPASFASLPLSTGSISPSGAFQYMLGYPAGFLGGQTVLRDLYMISSPVAVQETRMIGGGAGVDTMVFNGSIAGQHGSSGGAVIGHEGTLTGIPTFMDGEAGPTTDDNVLNAISINYINRDLKQDTGFTLNEFLARSDLKAIADEFIKQHGDEYRHLYTDSWKKHQQILIPGAQ
ncbi:hypothetical protein A2841_03895 [Candidatus Kaiserbacteria bacterium RIFCSPHIGHO2_01_FULL_48_10]|uniref:Serine protease n=1 Tax=Candidatus Kaiserbacteria bacterium RIFCSPHIGHO2_01_FULL_48_10 TaxID=1798476 RepID=A0A1F6C2K6_9BACT|nr:MAG: hypothetical protein A2841_03895 [Candidatus Kaiserbacteria bacterium RIFCSPHIGHO2_01_FULL_48_10]